MLYLIISVILFGLVHPLSKVILDTGIPLSYFCILYILIRLLILLVLFLKQKNIALDKKKLYLLFCLGGFGAGIQYFEFKGISDGLSPGLVTFLVFSYPIWLMIANLFSGNSKAKYLNIIKVICGVVGVYLICSGASNVFGESSLGLMLSPIIASVFMASWIGLSSYLSKNNVSPIAISFFCDIFALVILLGTLNSSLISDWQVAADWLQSPVNILLIMFYSIFVGLIPNLLFYMASKKVPVLKVGLLMTLEPVLSVFYSSLIWKESIGVSFVVGAIFILIANINLKKI